MLCNGAPATARNPCNCRPVPGALVALQQHPTSVHAPGKQLICVRGQPQRHLRPASIVAAQRGALGWLLAAQYRSSVAGKRRVARSAQGRVGRPVLTPLRSLPLPRRLPQRPA